MSQKHTIAFDGALNYFFVWNMFCPKTPTQSLDEDFPFGQCFFKILGIGDWITMNYPSLAFFNKD